VNYRNKINLISFFYVYGVHTFFAFLQVKLHFIPFVYLVNKAAGMNKSFFIRVIMFDEAESFFSIEKLNGPLVFVTHCISIKLFNGLKGRFKYGNKEEMISGRFFLLFFPEKNYLHLTNPLRIYKNSPFFLIPLQRPFFRPLSMNTTANGQTIAYTLPSGFPHMRYEGAVIYRG
jgi:hypothetical protein